MELNHEKSNFVHIHIISTLAVSQDSKFDNHIVENILELQELIYEDSYGCTELCGNPTCCIAVEFKMVTDIVQAKLRSHSMTITLK